jgi:hypothetical protein
VCTEACLLPIIFAMLQDRYRHLYGLAILHTWICIERMDDNCLFILEKRLCEVTHSHDHNYMEAPDRILFFRCTSIS